MFIILIAHVPGNWLTLWIPARFGFSDATETFVFCSGMASAIAFGRVFQERGLLMGTARVAHRIWQVYWAHIGLFVAVAVTMVALNELSIGNRDYVGQLNLYPFFNNAQPNLLGLLTLTYVPNYFDILPMYLVILAMMPVMIGLARIHVLITFGAVVGIWMAANFADISFPAEPWSEREWFFNPFGWQLVFFTGFAFMAGWLPAPPVNRWLIFGALIVVLLSLPFAYFRFYRAFEILSEMRTEVSWFIAKTDFGLLRYVHFLATAYLAWVAVGVGGRRLLPPSSGGRLAAFWRVSLAWIMKVGQQSLAVFITSMFLARLLGVMLDVFGRSYFSMALVNLFGFSVLIGMAYAVGWFKSQPWKTERAKHAAS